MGCGRLRPAEAGTAPGWSLATEGLQPMDCSLGAGGVVRVSKQPEAGILTKGPTPPESSPRPHCREKKGAPKAVSDLSLINHFALKKYIYYS